ncbi:MAG: hypothetical protein ACJ0FL_00050 [Gammaproteobacteria bacterium]
MSIQILLGILIVILIVGLFLIYDALTDIYSSISHSSKAIEVELFEIRHKLNN